MRSAETSGVGASGVGAEQNRANTRQVNDSTASTGRQSCGLVLFPITAAVAFTALLAALLFVSYDIVRTLDNA
ncbi:MAG: hypothetical protein MO846_01675 [Candidatus Devosia symbiotica]|nr:hypothetical protein [Candidatus Devosia symbiotica]